MSGHHSSYPAIRLRRTRASEWSRRLHAETVLTPADLIWPLFVCDGDGVEQPVGSLPGVSRWSVDNIVARGREARGLGIPCIALFPTTPPALKTEDGREALNPDNLMCRAVRALKDAVPEVGVLTDVALDPYTSHGHDGLVDAAGYVVNDTTAELLIAQALNQARAGADIIAPSDMMDGRIGLIRGALEDGGHHNVQIMSYAAKYASAFYGPFRDAVGSRGLLKGDKKTYQMDASQRRGGAARGGARPGRGGRHGDGQAGAALPRHRPPREGSVRGAGVRLSGVGRVRDDRGGGSGRRGRA